MMDIPKLHPNLQPQNTQGGQNVQPEYKLQVAREKSLAHAAMAGYQGASAQTTISTSLAQRSWGLGTAAIEGVNRLMNAVTTIFTTPRPAPVVSGGGSSTSQTETKPVEIPAPPPPPPATPQSLIPHWAQMFEYTGKSEWRPGGASQKAYVDLREELKGRVDTIEILSPDGTTVIARGRLEKTLENGKQRFRFDKTGKDIPPGAIIKATLKPNKDGGHGGIRYIEIPKPGQAFKW